MKDPWEGWESADDLVSLGKQVDPKMTRWKLTRLHKRDVIPRPRTRPLVGRAGTESLYPPGTSIRLLEVCRQKQSEKLLDEVAWNLWWADSGPITDGVRSVLTKTARDQDRIVDKVRHFIQADDELTDEGDDFIDAAGRAKLHNEPMAWVRRRLSGRQSDPEEFERFMLGCIRIVRGEELKPGEVADFEHSIGIDTARRFTLGTGEPWAPEGSMADAITWMADMLRVPFAATAESITDAELEGARQDAKAFLGLFVKLGTSMQSIFGRWGPGFSLLGRAARWMLGDPKNQAFAILLFHRMRVEPRFTDGFEQLRPVTKSWDGHFASFETLQQVHAAVPALGEAVTKRLLGDAMQSEAGQQRLYETIHRVRENHADEIDEFFAEHPELLEHLKQGTG